MFPELTMHPEYLRGQTLAWCNQLAAKTGKYEYTWNSTYEGQSAENILTEKHSSEKGIRTTGFYYLIQANAS